MSKFIGDVSAYAYAVSKGYTGTEEEFAELMASYADVGQTAVDAKDAAVAAKTAAQTAATTATNKASEATTAAETATTKADEASTSASTATSAKDTAVSAASTATTKATEATTAAATATSAKTEAVAANTAAQSAKTAAQMAQTGAETAAASVEASAAQIQTNADDISELKEDLNALYITNNVKSDFTKGSYIALNVSYGTVVDFNPVTHSVFAHIIIPCKKGDTFTITGTGASSPRLWGFTDTDKKLLSVEGANMARTDLEKTADQDGYFICNVTQALTYDLDYTHLFNADNYEGLKTKLASLESDVHDVETDLSDIYALDVAFSQNGYINSDGTVSSHNDYRCTDYINVSANGTFIPIEYRLKVFSNTKIGLYDANKDVLSIISPSTSSSLEEVTDTLNYVDGLVYARFCTAITNSYDGYYLKYTTIKNQLALTNYDNAFCNYNGNEISMFRKGLCIGDSLTRGTLNYYQDGGTGHYTSVVGINYPTYLGKLTGLDITNMGYAGYTAVDWWNIHQNDDLSGYDFAIIQLGVNDYGHYGGWTTPTETAFANIINKLKTQNKKMKIFVANIIPAISYSSDGYLAMSQSISDFVTGLDDENVILLDMQAHGHTRDAEAYNCGHLSAYGYWRLAQDYKNYIGYYINSHKSQFREVQFIGSDYYYTPV